MHHRLRRYGCPVAETIFASTPSVPSTLMPSSISYTRRPVRRSLDVMLLLHTPLHTDLSCSSMRQMGLVESLSSPSSSIQLGVGVLLLF